ncbi:MAG: hypothetical protein MJ252_09510 [archaeon]|nr:hypothetical protein [archaeon]
MSQNRPKLSDQDINIYGIDERNRSLSTRIILPKEFVPGLKPKKCLDKPSPLNSKKITLSSVKKFSLDEGEAVSFDGDECSDESIEEKTKKFTLDEEDLSEDEGIFKEEGNIEINKINSENLTEKENEKKSNKVKFKVKEEEEKIPSEDPSDNLSFTRSSLKKLRKSSLHSNKGKDDFTLGSTAKILKFEFGEILPFQADMFKSLKMRSTSTRHVDRNFISLTPIKREFSQDSPGSNTKQRERERESSLYYWSIEKKRSSSIIGYLEVQSMERNNTKENSEFKCPLQEELTEEEKNSE